MWEGAHHLPFGWNKPCGNDKSVGRWWNSFIDGIFAACLETTDACLPLIQATLIISPGLTVSRPGHLFLSLLTYNPPARVTFQYFKTDDVTAILTLSCLSINRVKSYLTHIVWPCPPLWSHVVLFFSSFMCSVLLIFLFLLTGRLSLTVCLLVMTVFFGLRFS